MWILYIIKCKEPNHYYVGITTNINRRLEQHKTAQGMGARFTKKFGVIGYKIVEDNINNYEIAKEAEDILTIRMVHDGHSVTGGKWARFLGDRILKIEDLDAGIQHYPWCRLDSNIAVHNCYV